MALALYMAAAVAVGADITQTTQITQTGTADNQPAITDTFTGPLSHPCARMPVSRLDRRASPYEDSIQQYAEKYGVESAVIKAVIAIESCYNDKAESPKGAQGLMQLIPDTAERFGVSDSFDTRQNIHGGTRYLSWLSKRYQGDLVKVLAAYNAGEGRVDQYNGVPPYSETQHYVRNVLAVYKKLLGAVTKTPPLAPEAAAVAAVLEVQPAVASSVNSNVNNVNGSGFIRGGSPVPVKPVLQQAVARVAPPSAQPAAPQRVKVVYQAPVRPSKPGRGGLQVNKARAPHLYKQPGQKLQ